MDVTRFLLRRRAASFAALVLSVTLGGVFSGAPAISGLADQSAAAGQLFEVKELLGSSAQAPLTGGNILVTSNNTIFEYTTAGVEVQAIDVPYGNGDYPSTEYVRDITVDQNGNIAAYAGTFDPFLSTYDVSGDTWTHATHPGWSTVNNGNFGGIASFQNYVYVTDMGTFGAEEAKGIVRFDTSDYSSQRFADGVDFVDLTVGQDGFLYGLASLTDVHVYDPLSMSLLRTIELETSVRGIAVSEAQQIFGVHGDIFRFDSDGVLQQQLGGTSLPADIDAAGDGRLVIGTRYGAVLLTDELLTGVSSFSVGGSHTFVSFADPRVPPTTCADFDGDVLCDVNDPDDDNDGVPDTTDVDDNDPNVTGVDSDGDSCDDAAVGVDGTGPQPDTDPANDGPDFDRDGLCDTGDPDDDNDGVLDAIDIDDNDPNVTGVDSDGDSCDDAAVGVDGTGPLPDTDPANDGPDFDRDGLCDAGDPDDDNDGCDDARELQGKEAVSSGGGRDPLYFWDFFDVWTGSPAAKDRTVGVGDIGALVARFGSSEEPPPTKAEALAQALIPPPPAPAYHAAFDRGGPLAGQNVWNLQPPDGSINIVDVGSLVAQFGHSCA